MARRVALSASDRRRVSLTSHEAAGGPVERRVLPAAAVASLDNGALRRSHRDPRPAEPGPGLADAPELSPEADRLAVPEADLSGDAAEVWRDVIRTARPWLCRDSTAAQPPRALSTPPTIERDVLTTEATRREEKRAAAAEAAKDIETDRLAAAEAARRDQTLMHFETRVIGYRPDSCRITLQGARRGRSASSTPNSRPDRPRRAQGKEASRVVGTLEQPAAAERRTSTREVTP